MPNSIVKSNKNDVQKMSEKDSKVLIKCPNGDEEKEYLQVMQFHFDHVLASMSQPFLSVIRKELYINTSSVKDKKSQKSNF